jgi:hypothetical protein
VLQNHTNSFKNRKAVNKNFFYHLIYRPINFPIVNPQYPLYEDEPDRSLRTIVESSDENDDVPQRTAARLNEDLKPYQTMRLTKQIPSIPQ